MTTYSPSELIFGFSPSMPLDKDIDFDPNVPENIINILLIELTY